MNSESVLNQNMENLKSNLSSILCYQNFDVEDHQLEIDSYHMNAERYDNQSYEMITMMQNCKIDYGNQPNSRTDLKRNFSSTRGKENALTNVSHFNFNDQINDPTLANAYGYGDDNWSQYTGNNNVKKNDINIINLNGNLKKFIKSRIHSKRLKLQKPYFQMKNRLKIDIFLNLKDEPVTIDMKRTGLIQRKDLHDISDCELVQIAVSDWSYFLLKLIDDRKIVEKDVLKRQVEVKAMRSKPLEVTVAVMINKTYEEYVYRSNFLPYVHKYCIDQGIMFEELLEDLWQDVKDALFQLSDPQFDITPVNAIRNLTNFIGNFHNKDMGKKWMESLNKMINGIKKLINHLWMLVVLVKNRDISEVLE